MARKKYSFGRMTEEEKISRYLDYLEEKDELVKNYSSNNHSCEDDMMSSEEWLERLYMD